MAVRVFPLRKSVVVCLAAISISAAAARATEVYSNPKWSGYAIDVKGVRREAASYPGSRPPWAADMVNAVGPEYFESDRRQRHEGQGFFRLSLDSKTGAVVKVEVVKSTGFVSLDRCATAALRQWRWLPGKWREITMPVTFTLSSRPKVPKDARLLPPVRY